jgi:hypothetical protein
MAADQYIGDLQNAGLQVLKVRLLVGWTRRDESGFGKGDQAGVGPRCAEADHVRTA